MGARLMIGIGGLADDGVQRFRRAHDCFCLRNVRAVVSAQLCRGSLNCRKFRKNLRFARSQRLSDWRKMGGKLSILILSSHSFGPIPREPIVAIAIVRLTNFA